MDVLKIVVGSPAYWCDMFIHVNTLVKKGTDPLRVIIDSSVMLMSLGT